MSNIFLDSQNFVNSFEDAPDKLRAELGTYYGIDPTQGNLAVLENKKTGKIQSTKLITPVEQDNQVLVPIKTQRIYFYGTENEYRDQIQWREYVESIVRQNVSYADHTYILADISVDNTFENNYFYPAFEDETKVQNTNLLLNYNLLNYKHNDTAKYVKDIAAYRTEFDDANYEVKDDLKIKKLMEEYSGRLLNYTGSLTEASERQRNIFILSSEINNISVDEKRDQDGVLLSLPPFPFNYKKSLYSNHANPQQNRTKEVLVDNRMEKFIHQAIKTNLAFQNVSFRTPDGVNVNVRAHNLIDTVLGTNLVSFTKNFDELFLLNEDELNYDSPVDRFVNGVRAINFLSGFTSILKLPNLLKNIEQIYDSRGCVNNHIGYKIEKYIDNDVTLPAQTFYLNSLNYDLIDTQMKYGRKYIYKTFALVAVYGSSYRYNNLHVSVDEDSMLNLSADSNGEVVLNQNPDLDSSKKYRAFVDVEVQPSVQIAEIPIDEHSVMFYDQPTMPPEVLLYNQSGKNSLEAILSPNLNSNHDVNYEFKKITTGDNLELERLKLSRDNIYGTVFSSDYFTGRYEVYRMDEKPESISDFANNFLVEVDMDATIAYQAPVGAPSAPPTNTSTGRPLTIVREFKQNNQVAHFEDDLIPNKKYYYLFRTLTYHGTPSNYTPIYEVELIQDSDETKINVSQYKIPQPAKHEYRRMAKRIMRITPNFDHLVFNGDENNVADALQNLGVFESNKLLSLSNDGEKFKIRITSKHTGKKMDINLTVKLKDETI